MFSMDNTSSIWQEAEDHWASLYAAIEPAGLFVIYAP
jgi:hypothetical protein